MRFHLTLTPARQVIPFNYQASLVGVLHRWLGVNDYHDELSLYGFSQLLGTRQIQPAPDRTEPAGPPTENGFFYPQGAHFFIHAHAPSFFVPLVEGIQADSSVLGGMQVDRIEIEHEPALTAATSGNPMAAIFLCRSPIFLKSRPPLEEGHKYARFLYFDAPESDDVLTAVMHSKLRMAGLPTQGCRVSFERTMTIHRRVTAVTYRNMYLKASICPIRIEGSVEQIVFGWNVGAGHSTGIGFGALDYLKTE